MVASCGALSQADQPAHAARRRLDRHGWPGAVVLASGHGAAAADRRHCKDDTDEQQPRPAPIPRPVVLAASAWRRGPRSRPGWARPVQLTSMPSSVGSTTTASVAATVTATSAARIGGSRHLCRLYAAYQDCRLPCGLRLPACCVSTQTRLVHMQRASVQRHLLQSRER